MDVELGWNCTGTAVGSSWTTLDWDPIFSLIQPRALAVQSNVYHRLSLRVGAAIHMERHKSLRAYHRRLSWSGREPPWLAYTPELAAWST